MRVTGPRGEHYPSLLSDADYGRFREMLQSRTGISLGDQRKSLVAGRLIKRLRQLDTTSFADYYQRVSGCSREQQIAIDLLTTNETWFFREQVHFDFLAQEVLPSLRQQEKVRVWSAACSSGEEPYSLAMLLDRQLPAGNWEVVASDISSRVLEHARRGEYANTRTDGISSADRQRYCRPGPGNGFTVAEELRRRVRFEQVNLIAPLPALGSFDVIFLRNAMIYFNRQTKAKVVAQLLPQLKPGGYFIVSQMESLYGLTDQVQAVRPSIYRKPV
jgi:chemotaxis protein methyltransferase CheR